MKQKDLAFISTSFFQKKKSTLTPNITKGMDLSQVRKALHHFHRSKPTFISAQHVF
jgi:hypothetical protein